MKRQGWFTRIAGSSPSKLHSKFYRRSWLTTSMLALASLGSGCTSLTTPISGIPARRLPPQFRAEPRANLVPIDVARLSQEPPRQYTLDAGDILGIYIEGILPFVPPDQPPPPPPVNFPDKESVLPPSLGFPIAVQDDGTISLPLVRPIEVRGMSVDQVREVVRKAYLDARILREDGTKVLTPIVTLIQERTVNVIVVRQDLGANPMRNVQQQAFNRQGFLRGADESAAGNLIKLPAYQNDVLHALMATGGLPGLNAKNEVRVLRSNAKDQQARDRFIQEFYAHYYANPDPCGCPPPLPDDPSILRIPLRLPPGVTPSFRPEDILLQEGDIVYIESRDAEVFYTGGLLPGGEFPIPRDYDLDVLGAMAVAGSGVGAPRGGLFGGGGGGMMGAASAIGGVPPGRLFIVRKTPCDGQVTIEVDIAKAINDPRERPLVQPGDTILLQYKPEEELLNFSLGTFFTFGVQVLIRSIR